MMTLRFAALRDSWMAAQTDWDSQHGTARLWAKDPTLWTGGDEAAWLGWLGVADADPARLAELQDVVTNVVPASVSGILLLGMGGSSLAAEVVSRILPPGPRARQIRILDTTDPHTATRVMSETDWPRTMLVIASKSGTTIEPSLLLEVMLEAAREPLGGRPEAHAIAITDPGTSLAMRASMEGFAAVIAGDPSIGGRYSALSPFGLVPVALHGVGLVDYMRSARSMAIACKGPAWSNPGVQLGTFLGTAARAGRNKATLLIDPVLAPIGCWVEQLVAESTGKNGIAILPIDGEAAGDPGVYGSDRAFVRIRLSDSRDPLDTIGEALEAAGFPVFTIDVTGPSDIAGEFFRWEFATAVAAALMGVNPFDQPDVEASKKATRSITEALERGDDSIAARPVLVDGALVVNEPPAGANSAVDALFSLLTTVAPGDYVALVAFLPPGKEVESPLQRTRGRIRDALRAATILGFGPRFLHSTGQAFKGGPASGVFIQLTADVTDDVAIPGRSLTLGDVMAAQSAGDLQVIRDRGRRALHVHLCGDLQLALEQLDLAVREALSRNPAS